MIKRSGEPHEEQQNEMQYIEPKAKPSFAEKLTRNMALATMLVLAVSALKSARLPSGQTVLTAVQQLTQPNWDEHLGAIDFVGNFFPETVSVFFDSAPDTPLTAPCLGDAVHAWSAEEPYLSYQTGADRRVYAAAEGQVMALGHGMEEEWILRLRHENGLETLYYELAEVFVREGDPVSADTCLGTVIAGSQAVVEVRRAGRAVNPTALMQDREAAAP